MEGEFEELCSVCLHGEDQRSWWERIEDYGIRTKECGLILATHTIWGHGGLKMGLQSPVLDLYGISEAHHRWSGH